MEIEDLASGFRLFKGAYVVEGKCVSGGILDLKKIWMSASSVVSGRYSLAGEQSMASLISAWDSDRLDKYLLPSRAIVLESSIAHASLHMLQVVPVRAINWTAFDELFIDAQ